jgi:hypothetical protein
MIHIETITLNGKQYDRTYSGTYYIERDGAQYIEAVDPLNSGRQYTETDIPLPEIELTVEEALEIITGGVI